MLLLLAADGRTQETIPRDYRPDEVVSFDSSLPMPSALDILNQYSKKFEGKIIIDPTGHSGPIGVMVNNMYWKRAFEFILRSNLLKFVEHEKYYEVVPLGAATARAEETLSTGTREVEIHAVFFEADYQTLLEAGIDWSIIKRGKVAVNSRFGSEVTKDLFSVQLTDRYRLWDVSALLRTFETLNKGEIIANPQIKVMEGEQGKIKVGTNFFLTTRDFAGNTRFTEYESGIILTVTPHIIGQGDSMFIHLDISAERSSVFPDPVNTTKAITESRTQVLLLSGEETAIAGLFSNEVRDTRKGIPLLKDLPPWFFGLRYLFGFTSKEVKKKELVILLRATVIPTVAERLGMRLGQKNILEQKRLEFRRKLRQLRGKKPSKYNSFSDGKDHSDNNFGRTNSTSNTSLSFQTDNSKRALSRAPFYYGVEVGTFSDRNAAVKLSRDYQLKGYKVGILQERDLKTTLVQYRLLVGAYVKEAEARRLANYFRNQNGIGTKVVRFKSSK
ncbi:MAG: SPOR domain-containing protein [bacterium]